MRPLVGQNPAKGLADGPVPRQNRGVKATLATLAIVVLALTSCGGDDDGGSADTGASSEGTQVAVEDLSSYETVADLNAALAADGIDCTLEYEGLVDEVRELSQCTIEGGQAILTIWYDDGLFTDFVGGTPAAVAYGENWTVELADPTVVATVADAAGGTTTDA